MTTTGSHTDRHTATIRAATRRFPLLGRPRPSCGPLATRATEVAALAAAAARGGPDSVNDAAHTLNKAALIASDCGLPDLATTWCWRHIDCYRRLSTLTALQAGYLLEPVLNLVRLHIRADHGQSALRLLHDMYAAVTTGTDLVVDDHTLPLANLTGTREQRRGLRQWAWLQYLSEGVRIHAHNNQWDHAAEHAGHLNGIGLHLMDGRQADIIAHHLRGEHSNARDVLEASTLTQPWEHQVGACLAALCATPANADRHVAALIDQLDARPATAEYVVYSTRLALTIAALATDHDKSAGRHALHHAAQVAIGFGDGYAAREVLHHRTTLTLPNAQHSTLTQVVADAGLGAGTMSPATHEQLADAVDIAAEILSEAHVDQWLAPDTGIAVRGAWSAPSRVRISGTGTT